MKNQVQVIDNISKSVLFETTFAKINEAYSFATLMEQEGLDISIVAPGLPETLIKCLSSDDRAMTEYKESLDQEISSHENDLGCTTCIPVKN